ncbi:aldehyde reductase [Apiospora arundinis]
MLQILAQHQGSLFTLTGQHEQLAAMDHITNLAIPRGALVLVTGSTGSVGSAVTNELLKAGLKVRAVVRSLEKGGYLSDVFEKRYGPNVFEIVHAENLLDLGGAGGGGERWVGEIVPLEVWFWATDRLHADCAGVVHMATDTSLGTSPDQVITPTVNLARAVLGAAAKTPTVRRVVFTSSAATLPRLHEPVHITPSSWASDDIVRMAWSSSSSSSINDPTVKALIVYAASKIEAERACWAFMREEGQQQQQQPRRSFVLNTVVPMTCLGAFAHPRLVSSMNGMLLGTWRGDPGAADVMRAIGAQCHVDLEDPGLLHLAALVLDDVSGERVLALGEVFHYEDVLGVMRKMDPARVELLLSAETKEAETETSSSSPGVRATVERGRYRELLTRMGKEQPTGLEESIRRAVISSTTSS